MEEMRRKAKKKRKEKRKKWKKEVWSGKRERNSLNLFPQKKFPIATPMQKCMQLYTELQLLGHNVLQTLSQGFVPGPHWKTCFPDRITSHPLT